MTIKVAQSAGFCYGVRRAVQMAELAAEQGVPCVMLGPIIHNKDMIDHLARKGVGLVERPEDVPAGYEVIIRSHGESQAVHEALQAKGVNILDATCPNVTHIHQIVSQAESRGRVPVIIGTPDHPEVQAIAGWCRHPVVLRDGQALAQWLADDPQRRTLPLTFVSQTTSTKRFGKKAWKSQKKSVQTQNFLIQYVELHRSANGKPAKLRRNVRQWWSLETEKALIPNGWRRYAGRNVPASV